MASSHQSGATTSASKTISSPTTETRVSCSTDRATTLSSAITPSRGTETLASPSSSLCVSQQGRTHDKYDNKPCWSILYGDYTLRTLPYCNRAWLPRHFFLLYLVKKMVLSWEEMFCRLFVGSGKQKWQMALEKSVAQIWERGVINRTSGDNVSVAQRYWQCCDETNVQRISDGNQCGIRGIRPEVKTYMRFVFLFPLSSNWN